NNPWPHTRNPRRENRRPIIASVARMDDLALVAAKGARGVKDERELQRAARSDGMDGEPKLTRDSRELPSVRPGEANLVAQFHQAACNAHGAIVGAAAFEQRVEVQNAQAGHGPFSVRAF